MTLGTRPKRPAYPKKEGPPAWLVFVVGVALVFGGFYLWQGIQNFLRTGGRGVVEATQRAVQVSTATAERSTEVAINRTPLPSATAIPDCQDFIVSVPNAIVRQAPTTNSEIVTAFNQGTHVCVLGRDSASGWYIVDSDPTTRRRETAYMHESVLEAVNPTPTPSDTPSPLPTVTALPTSTATETPLPAPTATPNPDASATPTPSPTPTATDAFQSA